MKRNLYITNSKLCEASKWRSKSPLVDEHDFPRTGFSCSLARLFVTFGGSGGIMTTAGQELPYPCSPQVKTRGSLLGVM